MKLTQSSLFKQKRQVLASLPFKNYYCGCGIVFQTREDFKSHVLRNHDPYFVRGSSHYLTHMTLIVMPVNCWSISSMKDHIEVKPSDQQEQVQDVMIQTVEQTKPSEEILRARKPKSALRKQPKKECRREKQEKKEIKKSAEGNQASLSQKNIQYHGLLLKTNKPRNDNLFSCGKCQQTFEEIGSFISHCFESCHCIEHQNSSHIISFQENQPVQRKTTKSSINKNSQANVVKSQKHPFKKGIQIDQITQFKRNIYQLLAQENKETNFTCGCGKHLNTKQERLACSIKGHLKTHQQILPENSSHILLQKIKNNGLSSFIIIPVDLPDNGQPWFCPCRPNIAMNKQTFVRHIVCIHKGISPAYKPEDFIEAEE